jgi:alpha-1,2-mannosyltransferase
VLVRRSLPVSPTTRALVAVLLLHALAVPAILHVAFHTQREATIIGDVDQFMRRSQAADSWRPMEAARAYATDHPRADIYAEIFFRRRVKFQYAPSSLLFTGTLTRTVLNWISWLSVWLTIAFSVAVFIASTKRMRRQRFAPRAAGDIAAAAAAAVALSLTFHPLMKGYALGQIQVWVDALFAAGVWCWYAEWEFSAGTVVGVACLIKPPLAPLVLWMLARRKWRMLAGAAAAASVGLAVSIAVFGLASHLSYVHVLAYISPRGEAYFPNQSMNGLLNRLLGNGSNLQFDDNAFSPVNAVVSTVSTLTTMLLLGAALLVPHANDRRSRALDFAIASLTVTMMSPIAWEHHYGIVLPLFALVVPASIDATASAARAALALAVSFMLIGQFIEPAQRLADTAFNPLQSYTFFGALLLLGCCYYALGRAPSEAKQDREASAPEVERAEIDRRVLAL